MNSGRIFKAKADRRFTVIPNDILEDKGLSLKAIGLLCYLLKLPEDWEIHKSRLHTQLKDGRDAVINAFQELQDAGYIRAEKIRGERQKFTGFNYYVSDSKNFGKPVPEKPETVEPIPEKPKPENPVPENPELLKTVFTKDCITKQVSLTSDEVKLPPKPEIPVFPKIPIPENQKPAPKEKALFQKFIDIYDAWFKQENGIPPKLDGGAGNAAKCLIAYFQKIVKQRAQGEGRELSEADLEAEVLRGWKIVLDGWGTLEAFLQDKTRLVDINSNIQNILKQVKNGVTKAKPRTIQQANGKSAGAYELLDVLKTEIRAQGAGNGGTEV